jgi:hypothetical protein
MAVFSSINVFPFFFRLLDSYDEHYFMCMELEAFNDDVSYDCYSLKLNDPSYWRVDDDDSKGWATAIQVAAVCAILSASFGFIAFCLLASAVCFALPQRRLEHICILLFLAALFQILTLVASAADPCRGSTNCISKKFRFDIGANFAIFAFLFYVLAFVMTPTYYDDDVRRNKKNGGEQPLHQKRIEQHDYINERGEIIKEIIIHDYGDGDDNENEDDDEEEEVSKLHKSVVFLV